MALHNHPPHRSEPIAEVPTDQVQSECFEDIQRRERDEIANRREASEMGHRRDDLQTGLCLSGGGIRSACFNLGLLEALDAERYAPHEISEELDCKAKVHDQTSPLLGRRYLESFDYLSTVSGGSYVAGHLAVSSLGPPDERSNGEESEIAQENLVANSTFGSIEFTTNSVPRWFWAIGVWSIGMTFQLVKTGSILIVLLGTLALMLRALDSPEAARFCDAIGLQSDVARGFVPFWVMLYVTLVMYILKLKNRSARNWLIGCLGLILIYNASIFLAYLIGVELPFKWHVIFPLASVVLMMGHVWDWRPGAVALVFLLTTATILQLAGHRVWPHWSMGALFAILGLMLGLLMHAGTREPSVRTALLLPLLFGLVCLAGLITTGDIGLNQTPAETDRIRPNDQAHWFNDLANPLYNAAVAALGLTSLSFLRWNDLLRSTRAAGERIGNSVWAPVYRVVVFLCSYGFLLLLVFVVFGLLAFENISGYHRWRDLEPGGAFHRTDLRDWNRAWQQVRTDAELAPTRPMAKPPVTWRPFARELWDAAQGEDREHPSLQREQELLSKIRAVEARPLLWRFLPWNSSGIVPPVVQLYKDKAELIRRQNEVSKRVADFLSESRPRGGEGGARLDTLMPNFARDSEAGRAYIRTSKHLQDTLGGRVASPAPELASEIGANNRELLKLYLTDDLVRNRNAENPVIRASVVWGKDQWARLRIVLIAAAVWCLCCWIDKDANRFSLQTFYREHIRDEWLVRPPGKHGSGWIFDVAGAYHRARESATEESTPGRAPLLLINATVHGSRSMGDDPTIKESLFTFSPVGAGSVATGYWLGESYRDFIKKNHLDISQIVAISGAFLSPGQVPNPALAAIFHLLNIRTGWWVRRVRKHPWWALTDFFPFHVFQSLGIDRRDDDYFLLTDGAHVENLGLKVLLDRRCRLIVASDCSQKDDSGHRFTALLEVLRQAGGEGIEIGPFLTAKAYRHWLHERKFEEVRGRSSACNHKRSQGLQLLEPPPAPVKDKDKARSAAQANGRHEPVPAVAEAVEGQLSQEHYLFAVIRYPDEAGPTGIQEGLLIYVRPTLTGDEGDALLRAPFGSSFPEDPPLDQFYSAARMQTYRLLGRHVGRELAMEPVLREALQRIYSGKSPVPAKGESPRRSAFDACDDCLSICTARMERGFRPAASASGNGN